MREEGYSLQYTVKKVTDLLVVQNRFNHPTHLFFDMIKNILIIFHHIQHWPQSSQYAHHSDCAIIFLIFR